MATSLTGTLGTPLGHGTPGGHIAVAMIRRRSLSRPVTPRQRPGTSAARRFPAGRSGMRRAPGPTEYHPAAPYRGGQADCHAGPSPGQDPWPGRPAKGQAMNANAGTRHRVRGLPGPEGRPS